MIAAYRSPIAAFVKKPCSPMKNAPQGATTGASRSAGPPGPVRESIESRRSIRAPCRDAWVLHARGRPIGGTVASCPARPGHVRRRRAAAAATGSRRPHPGARSRGSRPGRRQRRSRGIFSAREIASRDWWGTQLVVLSACGTGVGEVPASGGVFGCGAPWSWRAPSRRWSACGTSTTRRRRSSIRRSRRRRPRAGAESLTERCAHLNQLAPEQGRSPVVSHTAWAFSSSRKSHP